MRTLATLAHVMRRWDVKHLLAPTWSRSEAELATFGEIAVRRVEPNHEVSRYGSVHFDGRISVRPETVRLAGRTFLAHPGDLVFSRIDVHNGAIGVVPTDLGVLAFTNEYPVYDLTTKDRLSPEFAQLLCRTSTFRANLEALVVGHTGRRRVAADEFESLLVPVPDRAEQASVVRFHIEQQRRTESLRNDADEQVADAIVTFAQELGLQPPDLVDVRRPFAVRASVLDRWNPTSAAAAAQGLTGDVRARFPVEQLGDLADVAYGISVSPANRPKQHPRPYLRVANVQDGYLDLDEIKYIDVPPESVPSYLLSEGDLLLCEGNSAALVGRPAIWRNEIEGCVHQNHVLRVRTRGRVSPAFLLAYMNTSPARAHFRSRAKETTNLATINSTDVKQLPVPAPPPEVQARLVATYLETRSAAEAALASATAVEEHARRQVEAAITAAIAPMPMDQDN